MATQQDNSFIIHGFALLHAITTVVCYIAGIEDPLFLTIWTMAMTVLLCNNKRLSVEFTAISVILSNVIGYILGMAIAAGIDLLTDIEFLARSTSTFITTEALGWSLVLLVPESKEKAEENKNRWLWSAVLGVLVARIIIGLLSDASLSDAMSLLVTNSAVLLLIICANIILLHYIHRGKGFKSKKASVLWHFILFLGCPAMGVLMIALGIPVRDPDIALSIPLYIEIFILTFIAQAFAYSIIYLVYYVASTKHQMAEERSKSHIAQLEYINLKQQVSPHFLFNCLNVLDALIAQGKTEEARSFNRKLARMYRYMLNTGNEALVPLEDELEYVDMYTDLLQVRFPSGIRTEKYIADPDLNRRYVVRYSVQMLVENAYKHNSISESNPLVIKITADADKVTVANNKIPKLNKTAESTGLGLKYIRQNYLDRGGHDIEITNTDLLYSVSLPLM